MEARREETSLLAGYVSAFSYLAGVLSGIAVVAAMLAPRGIPESHDIARWLTMMFVAAMILLLYGGLRLLLAAFVPLRVSWSRLRAPLTTLLFVIAFVGEWLLLYPSNDDKSLQYTYWKVGLYPFNLDLDDVTGVFWSDPGRREFVIGKTEQQLREKFGYLKPISKMTPNFQECYREVANGKKAFFIRESWLMIVFDGDNAIDLVLMKPC
ncbi:MAG: hypothetical protein HY243_10020 [Proteobacteria bacterium]|nr:hypothetical protein [Pseudomonadota bacterium]